jgi:hypothetical protein
MAVLFGDSIRGRPEFSWKSSPPSKKVRVDGSHLLDAIRSASAQGKTPSASVGSYVEGKLLQRSECLAYVIYCAKAA